MRFIQRVGRIGLDRARQFGGRRLALSASTGCAFWALSQAPSYLSTSPLPESGSVFAWGANQYGQLGLGTAVDVEKPQVIASLDHEGVVQVAAGCETAIALTSTGEVLSWGRGHKGELGQGEVMSVAVPRPLVIPPAVTVAMGKSHGAAIDEKGRVWVWGVVMRQMYRQPVLVEGLDVPCVSVACGRHHTLAVADDGRLFSWGKGNAGALGHGVKANSPTPKVVAALEGHRVKQVSAGADFSLILTEDGRAWSCGAADFGQTGQGTAFQRYCRLPTPIGALANKKVVEVAAGEYHAACCTEDGEMYVWGLGADGQLGTGTREFHNAAPQPQRMLKDHKIVHVSCGGGHTAAVTAEGQVWVMGRGRQGQLGLGGNEQLTSVAAPNTLPVQVGFFRSQPVRAVSLGADFSLAIV